MAEHIMTQQEANIIAHDYGFAPYDPLKCEPVIHDTDLRSLFFANTSGTVKVLIQYHRDQLEEHE